MSLEQKSKIEWRLFSVEAYPQDYFELLPGFIHPVNDYSSNSPVSVDLSIKRNKVCNAIIVASHISLANKSSGESLDVINFNECNF